MRRPKAFNRKAKTTRQLQMIIDSVDSNKKHLMLECLEKSYGIVEPACIGAEISRTTHYNWVRQDKQYARAVTKMEDLAIDMAETSLFTQIQAGNTAATTFFLKTRGKKRGYAEKEEIEIDVNLKPTIVRLVGKDDVVIIEGELE